MSLTFYIWHSIPVIILRKKVYEIITYSAVQNAVKYVITVNTL